MAVVATRAVNAPEPDAAGARDGGAGGNRGGFTGMLWDQGQRSPEAKCPEAAPCPSQTSSAACPTPLSAPIDRAAEDFNNSGSPVVDDDRAVPDARFWARIHTFSVTASSLSDRAVAAHKAWGHAIPGLVWVTDKPMPALEAAGATVRVVKHSFDAIFDRMTDRMLDIWADVWANQVKPQHQWVVRVWDDNFIWRPGMERQIRSVEQLSCCTPDRPVLVGPRRFFFQKLRGKPFGFAAGGPPWMLTRVAMEKLFGRDQTRASKAVAMHRAWAQKWCNEQLVSGVMCQAAEDMLLSVAAMRVGVSFFESNGMLPGSVFKTPSRSIEDTTKQDTQPWQLTALRCRLPGLTELSQHGLAPDTWAMHYVPPHKQQEVLDAYRAGCDQEITRALFDHTASGRYKELGLKPGDFLDLEAEIAAL